MSDDLRKRVVCPHCKAKLVLPLESTKSNFRCSTCGEISPVVPISYSTFLDPDDDGQVFRDEDYIPIRNTQIPPDRSPQSSQIRTILTAVASTLAIVAVSWFAWNQYSQHQKAEKTKAVSAWTQDSMQQKLTADANLAQYGVRVLSIDLIRVSDTKYEGMATVRTSNSPAEHQVKVNVTADGDRMMWEAPPGAFMFLFQEVFDSSTPTP